ncbi:MAG: hypothetical protein VX777_04055 [Chlamydiota bacterium]|nr:hypothetical protein [Chlamydiota bacterium]
MISITFSNPVVVGAGIGFVCATSYSYLLKKVTAEECKNDYNGQATDTALNNHLVVTGLGLTTFGAVIGGVVSVANGILN